MHIVSESYARQHREDAEHKARMRKLYNIYEVVSLKTDVDKLKKENEELRKRLKCAENNETYVRTYE